MEGGLQAAKCLAALSGLSELASFCSLETIKIMLGVNASSLEGLRPLNLVNALLYNRQWEYFDGLVGVAQVEHWAEHGRVLGSIASPVREATSMSLSISLSPLLPSYSL